MKIGTGIAIVGTWACAMASLLFVDEVSAFFCLIAMIVAYKLTGMFLEHELRNGD